MIPYTPIAGPHYHSDASIGKVMLTVMFALTPATLFGIFQFGWPAFNLFIVTIASSLLAEAVCLYLAEKPIMPFLSDGSAILTGWLLALCLPPWAPWWIGFLGGVMSLVLGKHVFGGVGQNIFNPAMLGRVILLISFPVEMTMWVHAQPMSAATSPGFLEGLDITFRGVQSIDAISSASVLGHVRTEISQGIPLTEVMSSSYDARAMAIGFTSGSMGETSALFLTLGGLLLLSLRIISWHIPVAMIGSVAVLAFIFNLVDADRYAGVELHVLSGGLILGAFFIATDLVTSPNTKWGKIIFGVGCGLLVYVIRTWGGYPEGIGFAVMLMNAATPIIDRYVRPRVYGHKRDGTPIPHPERRIPKPALDKGSKAGAKGE